MDANKRGERVGLVRLNLKKLKTIKPWNGVFLSFLICAIAAYIACIISANNIIFNADSFAAIHQAQLVTGGSTFDSRELRFARIPSIFPDLATLLVFTKLEPAKIHIIIANNSWLFATLFIFLQSEFGYLTCSKRASRIVVATLSSFTTLLLLKCSNGFQEAFGILISPVHHGGNVINSLLLGCLILWEINSLGQNPSKNHGILKTLLLSLTVFLGFTSNKLIFFTGVIPYIATSMIVCHKKSERQASRVTGAQTFDRSWRLLIILFASTAALIILGIINNQCSFAMKLEVVHAWGQIFSIVLAEPLYLILISCLLITTLISVKTQFSRILSLGSLSSTISISAKKDTAAIAGLVFTLLFTLSTFTYTALISDSSVIPIRYILPLYTGASLSLLILASLSLMRLRLAICSNLTHKNKYLLLAIASIPLATLSFLTVPSIFTSRNYLIWRQFSHAFQAKTSDTKPIILYLNSKGLSNGLSDFWGTELADAGYLYSEISSKISIEPIKYDGSPYLWSHSKKQFFDQTKPLSLKPYNFIISKDPVFMEKLKNTLGPMKIVNLSNGFQLVIFDKSNEQLHPFIKQTLQKGLSKSQVECI